MRCCCDLLENSYLCGISNNSDCNWSIRLHVVICLKIRTFVVSATTTEEAALDRICCDLLENSYLCGISNNRLIINVYVISVVICLKIRTFVVSATTVLFQLYSVSCCDLLENSYLCGISNNREKFLTLLLDVVICLKIRTFVVSATTKIALMPITYPL